MKTYFKWSIVWDDYEYVVGDSIMRKMIILLLSVLSLTLISGQASAHRWRNCDVWWQNGVKYVSCYKYRGHGYYYHHRHHNGYWGHHYGYHGGHHGHHGGHGHHR